MAISVVNQNPAVTHESNLDTVSVGASPFVLVNTYQHPVRVFVSGTVTNLEYKQPGWLASDFQVVIILASTVVDLNPNDSLRITYVTPPTVKW